MKRADHLLALVAASSCGASSLSFAQNDASDADDLTAVIALQGKPCGRVVSVAKRDDNDFVAACQDGHRYHVYVRDGRVVVEEA